MNGPEQERIGRIEQRLTDIERWLAELAKQLERRFDGRLGPRPQSSADVQGQMDRFKSELEKAIGADNPPSEAPPADRTKLCTTDGRPVAEARASQTNDTGQHASYIVLCEDERKKGFVRPYRDAYKHEACGAVTSMGRALSETYARDPSFYSATFCVNCNQHRPVGEFVWTADGQRVGS